MNQPVAIPDISSPTRILLAEDHEVVRNGIRSLLERQPDFRVIAEAGNGAEVLDLLKSGLMPDLILTDINMPGMGGIELIETLKSSVKQTRLMILSMLDNENFVVKAFKSGASGYLLKSVSSTELIFAIRYVAGGGEYVCADIAMRLVKRMVRVPQIASWADLPDLNLSDRDAEVLELIAEGFTNLEIANKLFTSKRTIEGYRQSLMNRTGTRNTAALIKFALLNGLIG